MNKRNELLILVFYADLIEMIFTWLNHDDFEDIFDKWNYSITNSLNNNSKCLVIVTNLSRIHYKSIQYPLRTIFIIKEDYSESSTSKKGGLPDNGNIYDSINRVN